MSQLPAGEGSNPKIIPGSGVGTGETTKLMVVKKKKQQPQSAPKATLVIPAEVVEPQATSLGTPKTNPKKRLLNSVETASSSEPVSIYFQHIPFSTHGLNLLGWSDEEKTQSESNYGCGQNHHPQRSIRQSNQHIPSDWL